MAAPLNPPEINMPTTPQATVEVSVTSTEDTQNHIHVNKPDLSMVGLGPNATILWTVVTQDWAFDPLDGIRIKNDLDNEFTNAGPVDGGLGYTIEDINTDGLTYHYDIHLHHTKGFEAKLEDDPTIQNDE
jgi:hypothetical protein